MAITITDRGTGLVAGGVSATNTATVTGFTPASGAFIAVAVQGAFADGGAAATTYSIADTFGDSGGTSWTQVTIADPGLSGTVGTYSARASIFYRNIGTGAGSGAPTVTRTAGNIDQRLWINAVELSGVGAANLTATKVNGTAAGSGVSNTLTITFSSAPASTSLIYTNAIQDGATANALTPPAGYTSVQQAADAWGQDSETAYRNTGASTSHVWSSSTDPNGMLGVAIEFTDALAGTGSVTLGDVTSSGSGTGPTAPNAVSDLAGTAGDTQVVLTWSAPASNNSAITDYIVQYRRA